MRPTDTILILEDEENDRLLMARAFKKLAIGNPVKMLKNGQEGIAYLSGQGDYADRTKHPVPGAIITDLKMPLCSGLEFLEWLSTSTLRIIPTLVLSSSKSDRDIGTAYSFGSQSYMVKPPSFEALAALIKAIHEFWIRVEASPPRGVLPKSIPITG